MRTALRMAFVDGADLSQEEIVLDAAERSGLERDTIRELVADSAIKRRLRQDTDAAYAAGVHGVPTLEVDGRLYWGEDQLEIAAANR